MSIISKSSYSFFYINDHSIYLADDNKEGDMSVTNDIDNVVHNIFLVFNNFDPNKLFIAYRDSEGRFDQIVHRDGEFVNFLPLENMTEQAVKYQYQCWLKQRK